LLDIGADRIDIVAHDRSRDTIPGRAVDACDIRSGQAGAVTTGKIAERGARAADTRKTVAITVIAAGKAAVITETRLKVAQEMRVAELQRQVGLRRELLVLRTAAIVLEAIDDIAVGIGKVGAVESDRRYPALILVRGEIDGRRRQRAGAQYLLDEIIALVAPVILDAGIDLRAIAAPVRLEV